MFTRSIVEEVCHIFIRDLGGKQQREEDDYHEGETFSVMYFVNPLTRCRYELMGVMSEPWERPWGRSYSKIATSKRDSVVCVVPLRDGSPLLYFSINAALSSDLLQLYVGHRFDSQPVPRAALLMGRDGTYSTHESPMTIEKAEVEMQAGMPGTVIPVAYASLFPIFNAPTGGGYREYRSTGYPEIGVLPLPLFNDSRRDRSPNSSTMFALTPGARIDEGGALVEGEAFPAFKGKHMYPVFNTETEPPPWHTVRR